MQRKKKQTCYIEHDLKQLCAGGKKKKKAVGKNVRGTS